MSTRVNRRSFLRRGALSLLATPFSSSRPPESDALQQPRGGGAISTGDSAVYPIEERANRPGAYDVYERVTYVCGRGEVENYFRNMPKPAGYEQNLQTNCQLRAQTQNAGIKEIEN